MADDNGKKIEGEFRDAVNMTPAALEKWLDTEASKSVGWADGANKTTADGPEAVGHKEGHRIVAICRKKSADRTDDDLAHMRKVVGYVHRHLAQRPSGDVTDTRWRHSLMNWGHDPLKD